MLNVYDRATRKKTAVLQNAFDIIETQEINQIYTLSFTLPSEDEKNKYCLPRHYVRWGDTGELYRIKSPKVNDNDVGTITYECEHVITTLCDDIMFGSFTYGGRDVATDATIRWLLLRQAVTSEMTRNWKLGQCDFSRQFEYNWEQENLLNALYSIPKEFAAEYMWTFNTVNYPWTVNLVQINKNATPEYYLRAKSNILASGTSADYSNICTRIYPLGYGEGVNQLTIREATVVNAVTDSTNTKINGTAAWNGTRYGNTYIQSDQSYVDKYGIVSKVLVDRRFESANTLFAYAKSMLQVYQEPTMSRTFSVTDLYPITNKPLDDAQVGKICKMTQDNTTAVVTKTQRRLDSAGDLQIDLSTKASDVAANVASLADRVRIESVYAQGATQLYQHSKDANASSVKGMIMSLYFPSEMRQINKVLMRLKIGPFRSYSKTSAYGGAVDKETGEAGQISQYSESAGEINKNTESGGAINQNTGSGGEINQKTGYDGSISTSTGAGGAINTQSGSGGGSSGYTGVGGGGGNISLSADATVNVTDTGEANWTYGTPYTEVTELDIVCSSQGSSHSHEISLDTDDPGDHTHSLSAASTDDPGDHTHSFDPDEEETAGAGAHSHGLNGNTDDGGSHTHSVDGYTEEDGSHSHNVYIDDGEDDGHYHNIPRRRLQHDHPVSASVSINISNGGGYSGLEHSHPFHVDSHTHSISVPSHQHSLFVGGHTHSIYVGSHTHSIKVSSHTHHITVPAHKHQIKIDAHTHDITPGIYEFGRPTKFYIYVGGTLKATVNATSYNGDITAWLLNAQNQTPRNSWIDMEIRPDDLAYVQASVFVQGFVQSRGGGNY